MEFHLVTPLPEDVSGQVIGQLVLVQRPQRFQRSIILSIYDSAYDRGLAHSLALVMADRIDLLSVMIMAELTEDCPPEETRNECTLWFGARQFAPNERAFARHGHAFRLVLQRASVTPQPALMTNLQRRLAQLPSSSALPPFFGPSGVPPTWIADLSRAFYDHAAVEREDEGSVAYLTTWYLHAALRPSCVQSRPMRLRDQPTEWHRSIIERWSDQADSTLPTQLFWVTPMPPSSLTQSTLGHILVVQGLPSEQVAALITTRIRDQEGQAIHHVATFLPVQVSAEMVVEILALPGPIRRFPRRVGHGQTFLAPYTPQPIQSGFSLVVDVLGSRLPLPSEASPDAEALNLLQVQVRRTSRRNGHEQAAIEQQAYPSLVMPTSDFAVQHSWERLTTDAVAHAQWPQEQLPSSCKTLPRPISLDAMVPQEVPSIYVPCDEVRQLAQQLLHLDLGPNLPFSSVVKWHDSTLAARSGCLDWHGSPPLRFWFYTDGASSYAAGAGRRFASAAVVLLVDTADGLCFGGFRPFLVPVPATAPFVEHVAMLIAHLWCLQMHEWCLMMYGYWNVPVTFAFDCLAAGHAALGTWTCPQHQSVHRLTQSLTYWMQARYACQHSYIHVRSHQGDAWNEAADAVCCAALHEWIPAPDFAELFSQHLEPHLCAAEWLGYWHHASIGTVGYPSIKKDCFVYPLPLDVPAPDASSHALNDRDSETLNAPVENSELLLRCSTANVLTLYTTQNAVGGFMSARHEALMNSFHQLGVHVVGVQETRSKLQGHHAAEHFHVLSAPALRSGHCGVQSWVAKTIPIRNGHLVVCASHLRVLHHSARRLIVRLAVDGLRIIFIVGHVPCADELAAQSWWHDTSILLPSSYRSWPRIMLVDANGKVGSLTSKAIGDHHPCEENTHGALMHQWLVDHHMFAPQTFADHHSGPSATFAHSKGPESRIDYVLLDECLRCPNLTSRVLDIDLAIHRPDHFAVSVDVPLLIWKCRRDHTKNKTKLLHRTAPSPVGPPSVGWNLDVHTHAALLHRWLRHHQPARPRFPRKRHLRPCTWQLIQEKAGHWKRLRQIHTTMRLPPCAASSMLGVPHVH